MPSKQRSDLRAGLFILVSLVLAIGVVIAIRGVGNLLSHEEVRKVRFTLADDLGGLRVGDDIRIGGVKVGTIKTIDIAKEADGQSYILVGFTLPAKYPVTQQAHLSVQSTLTGTTDLNFDSLGGGPPLAADDVLIGHPSDYSSLFAEISADAPQVRAILATLRTSTVPHIDAAAAKLPETLASFHQAADRATVAVDQVGSVFGDTKGDIRGTMANLHQITDTARARLPELLDRANGLIAQATTTIDDAHGSLADVRASIANAKELTASARDVVVNNRSKLDGVIAELKTTGDNLSQATAEVRRSPWRLLYKPGPGELDNLELYDAARQFADGANHVDDAALALKDALRNPSTNADQINRLIERLTDAQTHFRGVEQKLWTSVKQ